MMLVCTCTGPLFERPWQWVVKNPPSPATQGKENVMSLLLLSEHYACTEGKRGSYCVLSLSSFNYT